MALPFYAQVIGSLIPHIRPFLYADAVWYPFIELLDTFEPLTSIIIPMNSYEYPWIASTSKTCTTYNIVDIELFKLPIFNWLCMMFKQTDVIVLIEKIPIDLNIYKIWETLRSSQPPPCAGDIVISDTDVYIICKDSTLFMLYRDDDDGDTNITVPDTFTEYVDDPLKYWQDTVATHVCISPTHPRYKNKTQTASRFRIKSTNKKRRGYDTDPFCVLTDNWQFDF